MNMKNYFSTIEQVPQLRLMDQWKLQLLNAANILNEVPLLFYPFQHDSRKHTSGKHNFSPTQSLSVAG